MLNHKCWVCWAVALAYLTLTVHTVQSTPQQDRSETPQRPQHVAPALLLSRQKRQFNGPDDFDPFFSGPIRRHRLQPGAELIFSNGNNNNLPTTAPTAPGSNGGDSGALNGPLVFVNNRPTIASTPPFVDPITTQEYRECFDRCPTTSEYNPICANDRNRYHNEQKFNCALRCGANIQVLRRGSCEGLFPISRG